jgi:NitT/TauT family transport system substrate-binding protein
MTHKFKLLLLLLMFIVVVIAGCTKEPQKPLRVGINPWTGYEPFYLAREKGYFDKAPVKLIEHTSASESLRLFRNGDIDAAALTLDETLQLLETGSDFTVVLVIDISHGGDAMLAHPDIKSVKYLKNKRVGCESTALGAYMLTRVLQTADMKPSDVKIVPLASSEMESRFRDLDAVVTFEPIKTRLLAAGARVLFDSSQIPGEVMDVLVVRNVFAENNPELVRELVKSWFRAIEYLGNNQRNAAEILAKRQKISPRQYLISQRGLRYPDIKENRTMLTGDSPTLLPVAQRLSAFMLENRLIAVAPDVRPILSGSYLKGISQ